MIERGNASQPGAVADDDGVNFAVFSSTAEMIELCLFDERGRQTARLPLPGRDGDMHHGYVPGLRPGQRYGFRAHGRWAPAEGLRHNASKLLLDPYARRLSGEFRWDSAVFDYVSVETRHEPNTKDSAPFMPKCVVTGPLDALPRGPEIPFADTIVYETNVRGYTMRHPAVDESLRGRFAGMTHGAVLGHLKALGVTSVELMPVQAWIDEHHLAEIGLRNYWGYNTVAFMAPMQRLAGADPNAEFRDMVRTIHDAGLEVILDIAFNHTGESNALGPVLSFKGLDNLAYYRTLPGQPSEYINDTGTGNTINADHPVVQALVLDSLGHWANTMGVDGFRFDLAPILGRHADGFSSGHPLLNAIVDDPALRHVKMIAEPWDPGPGGYQLGHFPGRWAEWNDRFRDGVRRFWRGDAGLAGDFAQRLHGSADLFGPAGRPPAASVNFVTAHDGFTLCDSVSYEHRHNEANGEDNRDGHAHNFSINYGVEGPSDDAGIEARRRRHRLNLLATLLVSQGTPMLLAGDEFGNTQVGNNNAYAQDNEIGWLDWSGLESDPEFTEQVRQLIRLRREMPLLRLADYIHDGLDTPGGRVTIGWHSAGGDTLEDHEWTEGRAKLVLLQRDNGPEDREQLAIVVNGSEENLRFHLPPAAGPHWSMRFTSTASGNVL
ncbi:MAG: glycogen debranching protein GlgX, partial [Woeseiaceae bacterium]|nr:glycogen debranching protein GlgX [Woeseiaceae bacterium]